MNKIVLASHGKLASGILSSLELICGEIKNISTLDCYLTENFDLNLEVKKIIEDNQENEIIIVTDLFGGSVNNEFINYIDRSNIFLIAGLNLPFLIELVGSSSNESTEEKIKKALKNSKESIQYCNESIKKELLEEEF
ncbi:PTS sugar transporter subunit IIA [Vagococcus fluvialis]|uniref:PTS sugar transporter subunit IIA n=1 Tax=Vagococcus fluvialis TaxID=2738 RepID=UPI003D132126